jgi:hypothetical protein
MMLVGHIVVAAPGVAMAQTTPGGAPNGSGNGNATTTDPSNQSTPLDASDLRNRTGPSGLSDRGVTGGAPNVSAAVSGNYTQSEGGGGGDGLFGFNMTEDVIQPTLNTTKQGLQEGMLYALNHSMEVTIGTPVPQDNDDNGIVFVPTNDGWKNMYHQYFIPYIFPLAIVFALISMIAKCGTMPWRALRNPTYDQSQAFVGFVLTLFAIAFTVPIVTVMHNIVDVLATGVAPSPEELVKSTKGLTNLGAGAIFAVLGAVVIGFTEALGLAFIYALRYGALFVIPWFLPLLVALAYNAPHKRLAGFASEMIWQYIGLLIQAVPVALLLRAAYALSWDFGFGGFIGMLASGAIFLAAIGLPILTSIGMFKAAPSVQSVATGAAGYVAGSRGAEYSRQAAGGAARGGYERMAAKKSDVAERIQSLANSVTGSNGPERGQTTINDFEDRTHPTSPTLNGIDNSPSDPTPLND